MAYTQLEAKSRKPKQIDTPRSLRRSGWVPGVVFGKGIESQSIKISEPKLVTFFKKAESVVELLVDGKTQLASIDEVQRHPVSSKLIHLSFLALRQDEKTTLTIPLSFVGSAAGSKEGGVVTHVMNDVDVQCLPSDAPSTIELDISELTLGHQITLKDLKMPQGVTLVATDLSETLVTCKPPAAEEAAPAPAIEGEGEASTEAPAEGATETKS